MNLPGLSAVSIAVTILYISGVWIIAHMVTLSKDPKSVPTHGMGRVVVELIKGNLYTYSGDQLKKIEI